MLRASFAVCASLDHILPDGNPGTSEDHMCYLYVCPRRQLEGTRKAGNLDKATIFSKLASGDKGQELSLYLLGHYLRGDCFESS